MANTGKILEPSQSVLIVEDDSGLRSQMRWALSDLDVHVAEDRKSALAALRKVDPCVVVLDLGLPPDPNGASEGLAALEAILSFKPSAKVIIASGNEDRANALKAVNLGAYDFYPKPVDIDVLHLIIERAKRLYGLEEENRLLSQEKRETALSGIIAASTEMLEACRMAERIAPSEVSVLLTGESGTGKELLARAVHELSSRNRFPFIAINCAAIPENLLESELFGHEKGAFTGAIKQTIGKIEHAGKGTLFLDEVGDMPLALQAKMLRFLQDRTIERVGGRTQINVDVRIISATNQVLDTLIEQGRFRDDLFYRLNEVGIHVPPLRQRDGDSALLAKYFMGKYSEGLGKKVKGFTTDALASITGYNWPGNVRELENRMKRAVVLAEGNMITAADLDLNSTDTVASFPSLKQVRERAEREAVVRAMAIVNNNVSSAAKLLGISRPTLYQLMQNLDIREKKDSKN
ncbi:MAG: PEP-CTERM-box response regulator transcription factor [Rhodospirillales bacterium]|nr:PEP-CTERM-box response regulator transcription factor [Rhodospirillales bacterium]